MNEFQPDDKFAEKVDEQKNIATIRSQARFDLHTIMSLNWNVTKVFFSLPSTITMCALFYGRVSVCSHLTLSFSVVDVFDSK